MVMCGVCVCVAWVFAAYVVCCVRRCVVYVDVMFVTDWLCFYDQFIM